MPDAVTVTLFNGATNLGSLSYTAATNAYDFDTIRANAADAAVPEPGSLLLVGTGLFAVARLVRLSPTFVLQELGFRHRYCRAWYPFRYNTSFRRQHLAGLPSSGVNPGMGLAQRTASP